MRTNIRFKKMYSFIQVFVTILCNFIVKALLWEILENQRKKVSIAAKKISNGR